MGMVISLACREGFLPALLRPSTQAEASLPPRDAGQGHVPKACSPKSPPNQVVSPTLLRSREAALFPSVQGASCLEFHHPKSFGFIFVGGSTFIATNHRFQRSKYYHISTALSQLQLLWKAAQILLRWQIPAQPHAAHKVMVPRSLSCMHRAVTRQNINK